MRALWIWGQLTTQGRELRVYAERAITVAGEIRTRIGSGDALWSRVRFGVLDRVAVLWLPLSMALIDPTRA
ncbi:hypothetical protein MKK75_06710 [Methylobacterium sp. J-030]|uniref:hypothetical protein n=1 Tax=Methylobacterium sp. J-030 TaxID=2836627 RepID=UPI001FBB0013|nr:hypothetical protein [Methylobacterium sp. J-030]MCJ2068497.1 hypothetical protein [Methylobacterium sp. J-030]